MSASNRRANAASTRPIKDAGGFSEASSSPFQSHHLGRQPGNGFSSNSARSSGNDQPPQQREPHAFGINSDDYGQAQSRNLDANRGWGSLGSWINTAVSTVSEVIENPNAVVSKAQTISQGIRNVATEQIDRVYESLDPEFEYQRERLNKDQAPQQPHKPNLQSPSPKTRGMESHRKDDLSDLLSSPSSVGKQTSKPQITDEQRSVSFPVAKLEYKGDEADQGADAWGDEDAWGDDWDDQGVDIQASPPKVQADSLSTESSPAVTKADIPAPVSATKAPAPGHADQAPIQSGNTTSLHPVVSGMPNSSRPPLAPSSAGARSVKDLFASDSRASAAQAQTKGSRLNVPGSPQDHATLEQPIQRRPSADLRPTEALFSTLDFASNALGSAMMGVHRKVTQAGQSNRAPQEDVYATEAPFVPHVPHTFVRPVQETPKKPKSNSSIDVVSGNVVSTGLGALEILGKKAVDVISDVRRGNHHGQGGTPGMADVFDESRSFQVPARMNFATLLEESGRHSGAAAQALASSVESKTSSLTRNRPELLEMAEVDKMETLLKSGSLESVYGDASIELLLGHKDFRRMVHLLESMGLQGTAHLRQLRNGTKRLATLVGDTMHAFEQEWHNRQSRASERDFFARDPIKHFFESKLMSVYFDGLRALVQFSVRSNDQILRLTEHFHVRLAENSGRTTPSENQERDVEAPQVLAVAEDLRQFLGSLISELKYICRIYQQTMDGVLTAAKGFTTPLDNLDWEDLVMGATKLKGLLSDRDINSAIGQIHAGCSNIQKILRSELITDVVQGRRALVLRPTPRPDTRVSNSPQQPTSAVSQSPASPLPSSSVLSPSLRPSVQSNAGKDKFSLTVGSSAGISSQRYPTPTPSTATLGRASPQPSDSSASHKSQRTAKTGPTRPPKADDDFFSILNGP
ncbi:hypothetical protein EMPS_11612 [Entomortierella parvispora]|uniref:Uncharacterized protein n=1 Tax=Entomortierella parvispora TaxID=205924 RepID=A0A9P3M2Q1_9FUNG|nr:hypothetical protein EMPS_11612 [Entomortierella parvispora]